MTIPMSNPYTTIQPTHVLVIIITILRLYYHLTSSNILSK